VRAALAAQLHSAAYRWCDNKDGNSLRRSSTDLIRLKLLASVSSVNVREKHGRQGLERDRASPTPRLLRDGCHLRVGWQGFSSATMLLMIPPSKHITRRLISASLSASPRCSRSCLREPRGSAHAKADRENLSRASAVPDLAHGLPLERHSSSLVTSAAAARLWLSPLRKQDYVRGSDFQVDAGGAFPIGPLIRVSGPSSQTWLPLTGTH